MVFDYLAVRLDAAQAAGMTMVVNWMVSDLQQSYRMNLSNSVLTTRADRWDEHAHASVTLERSVLDRLILRELVIADAVEGRLVVVSGDVRRIVNLFELFDDSFRVFEILEPKREV